MLDDEEVLKKDRLRVRPLSTYYVLHDTHAKDLGLVPPDDLLPLRSIDHARYVHVVEAGAGRAPSGMMFIAKNVREARDRAFRRAILERIPRSVLARAVGRQGKRFVFQAQVQIFFVQGLEPPAAPEPAPLYAEPAPPGDLELPRVPGDLSLPPEAPGSDLAMIETPGDLALPPEAPGSDLALPERLTAKDLPVPAPPDGSASLRRGAARLAPREAPRLGREPEETEGPARGPGGLGGRPRALGRSKAKDRPIRKRRKFGR